MERGWQVAGDGGAQRTRFGEGRGGLVGMGFMTSDDKVLQPIP